jgi:uncharacterized protein with HEPN domain
MKVGPHGDLLRLKDILWAISALDRHRTADRGVFDADELLKHFVWKQIEIIGEAASKIRLELRDKHPEIAWRQIIGMRNRLVHEYAALDWGMVWLVFSVESVRLRPQIEALLLELELHDSEDD